MAGSNERMKGIIAIIIIIVAGVFLYWYNSSQGGDARPRDMQVLTIDVETGKAVHVTKKPDDKYPLKNPETGKRTLWMAFASVEGKFIFPGPAYETIPESDFTQGHFGGATIKLHADWPVKMPPDFQP